MSTLTARSVILDMKEIANPKKARDLQWFFKTGPGEYGEGDVFLGITVPKTRSVAKKYYALSLTELQILLDSDFHEHRLCALVILNSQMQATKELAEKKKIFAFYIKNLKAGNINNWDLVDVSAPRIGEYLLSLEDPMKILLPLSKSKSLWQRRASIIFTFAFLKDGELDPSIEMSRRLVGDSHDLMHKAVGWTMREVGKRNILELRAFLTEHASTMPRTALRYSIEKLSPSERKKWLAF